MEETPHDAGTGPSEDPAPIGCTGPDTDSDGVCDADDICPQVADPEQLDSDFDGVGDACSPPVDRSCTSEGVCFIGPEPLPTYTPHAVAIGRELYMLGSNAMGHLWDGTRWQALSQPYTSDWLSFSASPGALWGIERPEPTGDGQPPHRLWRRDRQTSAWTGATLPIPATQVRAIDDAHVWLAGAAQLVLFDGQSFGSPLALGESVGDFQGTAPDDVWARGERLWHFDGAGWSAWPTQPCAGAHISALVPGAGVPWVECLDGGTRSIVRWENGAWVTEITQLPEGGVVPSVQLGLWVRTKQTLRRADGTGLHRALQGRGAREALSTDGMRLWHVANEGVAAEWDGTRWIERGIRAPQIHSTWWAPDGDLWAAGTNGFLAHRRGNRWERLEIGRDEDLLSVAANGDEVWVTAEGGIAGRRLPNGTWRFLAAPAFGWGPLTWMSSSPTSVGWIVGYFAALREDLGTGDLLQMPSPGSATNLSGSDELHFWAATRDGIFQWVPNKRGDAWSRRSPRPLQESRVGAKGDTVWGSIDGKLGRIAANGSWEELPFDDAQGADDLVVRGPSEVYVRSGGGSVSRHDGVRAELVRASGCQRLLESTRGIECVTSRGIERAREEVTEERLASTGLRLLRQRGDRWEPFGIDGSLAWSDGREGVVVRWGEVWRYRAGTWRKELELGGDRWISLAVGKEALYVAAAGGPGGSRIVRAAGGQVQEIWKGPQFLLGIALTGDELFAGGTGGFFQRWDGTQWSEAAPGLLDPTDAVWDVSAGSAPGELWVGSSQKGRLLHRSEGQWEWVEVPSQRAFTEVWAAGDVLWAVGGGGLWERTAAGWRRHEVGAIPLQDEGLGGPVDGRSGVFLDGGFEGVWYARPLP